MPRWTGDELAEFLNKAPAIKTAIERGGQRMRDLALVPFNTRLLADLISDGLSADAFGDIKSQVQLWRFTGDTALRGMARRRTCLRNADGKMVRRNLQANRLDTAQADPTAFDKLLKDNVLVVFRVIEMSLFGTTFSSTTQPAASLSPLRYRRNRRTASA